MALTEEIYALAADLAPEGTEEGLLRSLCRAAERSYQARVRKDLEPERYQESLVCAAAFLAVSYLPHRAGGAARQVRSFTVGEVSVTAAEGESLSAVTAGQLRQQAEALMAPYCATGDGFAFLGVRG